VCSVLRRRLHSATLAGIEGLGAVTHYLHTAATVQGIVFESFARSSQFSGKEFPIWSRIEARGKS
jgi:hypothetical protein